jgi:hypothetical protein
MLWMIAIKNCLLTKTAELSRDEGPMLIDFSLLLLHGW